MEDLKTLDFSKLETIDQIEAYLQENVGVKFSDMKERLCSNVNEKAEELTHDFANIAPYGEYDKILEDNDSMAEFLRAEATKAENWTLHEVRVEKHAGQDMLECIFVNKAVDDGDSLEGYVFTGKSGAIRHSFVQGNGKG